MIIEKKCDNCVIESGVYDYCYYCNNYAFGENEFSVDKFIPKEELVRQDEKEKIYKNIKKFIRVNMRNGCEDTIEKLLKEVKKWIS